ncbi:hypothetical protein [Desulfonema magnum]|uniref:Uncharacterized protein n=1 Tax=Desulfonema magnum TaxID=45655 RepID=A0A975BI19_9BACT|nr:hypothetical protein [Desulfonema magnum]QTA86089.1 Uncharacterized protein dnm_021070 [Desulfonema magnum]
MKFNTGIIRNILCFFILTALMLLWGCAVPSGPVCKKNEKNYCKTAERFTGQWYDYYKRALSCMEGKCYPETISELKQAIKRRPGEKRWANTYGMHFMDYFPHRETGIAYYFMGDYEAAKPELEFSIEQEASARANFYLDKVRMRIMQQKELEPGTPSIFIISPPCSHAEACKPEDEGETRFGTSEPESQIEASGNSQDGVQEPERNSQTEAAEAEENRALQKPRGGCDERWIRDDPVIISGTAEDKQYVSEIMLSGKPVFMEASEQRVTFREELTLNQGTHKINITARNLLGGEEQCAIILHVDRSGPVILIESFRAGKIQGRVLDESGISSFFTETHGSHEDIPRKTDGSFTVFLKSGTTDAILVARDRLGNETKAAITAYTNAENKSPMLLAQNGIRDSRLHSFSKDKDRPEIMLKGWPDQATVFKKNVDIEGQAESRSNIRELSIQVENWKPETGNWKLETGNWKLEAGNWKLETGNWKLETGNWKLETGNWKSNDQVSSFKFQVSFNQSVGLGLGKNMVTIRATDASGRTGTKKIFITRKIPSVLQSKYRYAVKMYPFDDFERTRETDSFQRFFFSFPVFWNRSQVMGKEKRAWFQHFLFMSFRSRSRFQVMEHEQLKMIFQEYELDTVPQTSQVPHAPGTPPERSEYHQENLKMPHSLLLADTSEDGNGIEVIARLIDIRTSEILAVKDVYDESKDRAALKSMAEKLSEKFHRAFPLTDGIITDKKKFFLPFPKSGLKAMSPGDSFPDSDSETAPKVTEGWPVIIYREKTPARNSATGRRFGSDTDIITDASMGKDDTVVISDQDVEIRAGDRVITR